MRTLPLFFPLLFLAACSGGGGERSLVRPADPRLVSILVEVYDPVTNYVWEGVSVRILEADQEWSGCTCTSPYENDWYLTGSDGRVYLDEFALGDAEVGFQRDVDGRALLMPNRGEDQATVVLVVDGVGFFPKVVEVPLSWNEPDVFIEVPFN